MLNSRRHPGLFMIGAAARLALAALGAGLLVAAVLVPIVGATGVTVRNAANDFNTMSVPSLGQIPSRSEILDANGHVIAYYYPGNIYRLPVSYNQIAPVMRQAIVAIEDNRFWEHGAFDLRGTTRALVNDLDGNPVQGGSTLAQQYVKNALVLTSTGNKQAQEAAIEDTTSRKIRELKIAAEVEHEMTKKQLLAAYLNVAFFNNNAYGIQVAAERYFSTSAADLTLPEAAMLAGLVENPTEYDPFTDPTNTIQRRNTVLDAMVSSGYITQAQANAAAKLPLGLKESSTPLQEGCTSPSAAPEAYFCDYVLAVMRKDKAFAKAYKVMTTTGGLTIQTTLDPADQQAAQNAVSYVEPSGNSYYNPGNNVDTEVLIQPGTGAIRAIAVNRPYGTGQGQNSVDFAVEKQYNGGSGVQTGSSSKLFTLVTALKQGVPFGFSISVPSKATITGYSNCQGDPVGPYQVHNDEGDPSSKTPIPYTLYTGTTQSINVFYAHLEQKVGLCNVVQTAASMGMTFANGVSLLQKDPALGEPYSMDNVPAFTLGVAAVAPMSMAAAYATVASGGVYCSPVAISKITTSKGVSLPVQSAGCHQVLSPAVADAANYILQGVIQSGTAAGRGIGVPAAGKTGTADSGYYAAFAGYTPRLVGYVSVFNPVNPTNTGPNGGAMLGQKACYREAPAEGGYLNCPAAEYGDNAPAATWQMTFDHADLGSPPAIFVGVPVNSPFNSMGNGAVAPKPTPAPSAPGGPGGGKHGKPVPGPNPIPTFPIVGPPTAAPGTDK